MSYFIQSKTYGVFPLLFYSKAKKSKMEKFCKNLCQALDPFSNEFFCTEKQFFYAVKYR